MAATASPEQPALSLDPSPVPNCPVSTPGHASQQISLTSPDASSGSISFDSSRPASQQSSRTSPSRSPSTGVKTKNAQSDSDLATLNNASTVVGKPSRQGSTFTTKAPTHVDVQQTSSTISSPSSPVSNNSAWSCMQGWISQRQWFGNSVGLTTLVATLFGLLIFGYRTYKLDIFNSHMAYRQICQGQIQINATIDNGCQTALNLPVPPSPYKLIQRALNSTKAVYAVLHAKGDPQWNGRHGVDPPTSSFHATSSLPYFLIPIVFGAFPLLVAAAFFAIRHMRKHARVEKPFSSPARNEVRVLRKYRDRPDVVTSEPNVKVLRHNPEEQHYLGQLRQSIRRILERDPEEQEALDGLRRRKWQSNEDEDSGSQGGGLPDDVSVSTLVTDWTKEGTGRRPSHVTIEGQLDGEDQQHEGLIELKTKGTNKTFFDPKTGEFIRLTPWKSTEDENDDGVKADEKGSTKKALARMGTGAVAFAGGKSVSDEIMEELDRDNILCESMKNRIPQRAGDSIAGLVTNEYPTGKPTIV